MKTYGLSAGKLQLRSIGPITFGPDGILFVADNSAAAIVAIEVEAASRTDVAAPPVEVVGVTSRLAAYLGASRDDVLIRGMAVHPVSRAIFLSVMRGRGNEAVPVLVRVLPTGDLEAVDFENVPFATTAVDDAPSPEDARTDVWLDGMNGPGEERESAGIRLHIARPRLRTSTVTDLAYSDGVLFVAGASNEEFASTLRRIPFPFTNSRTSTPLEIFHVSHGKYETAAPIKALVLYDDDSSVLASYLCTPVVHFDVDELKDKSLARGRTVAELGARNQPLDMVSYRHAGEEYFLISNTLHPLIKLPSAPIRTEEALNGTEDSVGVPREELDHPGVHWMANLGDEYILMMQRDRDEEYNLRAYSTASL
ncbi:hypothetical protein [Salinibacterium sp. ZJ454]|uniref:hypothetical protein n=1 Tax=Salinibacterium sp. ZJ454 TaxID=2708339 RepID=UPI001421FAC4|nr:hypothetical protein [Salinibacterium sp. ZJ454]